MSQAKADVRRFWLSVALAPVLTLALSFVAAVALTQWPGAGINGAQALVTSGVIVGFLLGALLAGINPTAPYAVAVYTGGLTVMCYWSIRHFWFGLEFSGEVAGYLLTAAALVLGAHLRNSYAAKKS